MDKVDGVEVVTKFCGRTRGASVDCGEERKEQSVGEERAEGS